MQKKGIEKETRKTDQISFGIDQKKKGNNW